MRRSPERYAQLKARFEMPLLFAALLTIPAIVIEQSHPDQTWRTLATAANWAIWLAFLVEFIVLLYTTPARSQWLREHPLEVVIVFFTPPFLQSVFQSVRALRIFRVLRVLRLATVTRQVFSLEGLRYVAILTLVTVLAGGAAFSSVESRSLNQGLYWAVTTMTTLGSRDEPTTNIGRILAVVLVIVGAGFLAVLTGAIAQRFTLNTSEAAPSDETKSLRAEMREVAHRLQRVEEILLGRHANDPTSTIWPEDVIRTRQMRPESQGAEITPAEQGGA
jgi:voltage-gated potassium channel